MNFLNDPIFDFCRIQPGRYQSEKIRKYISWHLPKNPTLQLNVGFVGNVGFLLGFFTEKKSVKMPGGTYRHYRHLDQNLPNVGNVGCHPGAFGRKILEAIFRISYRHNRHNRQLD